jgi:hypothetical protein
MKQLLSCIAILLVAVTASANTVTIGWEFPADQEANISGFAIYMRPDAGEYPDNPTVSPEVDERLTEIADLVDGTYWFCISATISVYGTESARSGEVGITFENGEVSYPFSVAAPTILTIQGTAD